MARVQLRDRELEYAMWWKRIDSFMDTEEIYDYESFVKFMKKGYNENKEEYVTGLSGKPVKQSHQLQGLWDWMNEKGKVQGLTQGKVEVIGGVKRKVVVARTVKMFKRSGKSYVGVWGKRGFITYKRYEKGDVAKQKQIYGL